MIKRQYFIYTETTMPNGSKTESFRQFWVRSLFSNPAKALKEKEKEIAEQLGVDIDKISVKAFNRV